MRATSLRLAIDDLDERGAIRTRVIGDVEIVGALGVEI